MATLRSTVPTIQKNGLRATVETHEKLQHMANECGVSKNAFLAMLVDNCELVEIRTLQPAVRIGKKANGNGEAFQGAPVAVAVA